MIFSVYDYDVLIGIGILIGLPLLLTFVSEREKFSLSVVLIYMTIINAFLVSTGILPLWTQVLFLIIMIGLGAMEFKTEGGI